MADVNYLNSNNAYRALAIIYENSDENNPVEKQQLMEALEANEHTFTSVMNDIEEAGIIEKDREKPGGKVRYYFKISDLYNWWEKILLEKVEEEIENQGNDAIGREFAGYIDHLKHKGGYSGFFSKWVRTYFNFIEESTLHKMCFEHIHYGISWESHNFEHRLLTSEDITCLRNLLIPVSNENFRKLRKSWYRPGFD